MKLKLQAREEDDNRSVAEYVKAKDYVTMRDLRSLVKLGLQVLSKEESLPDEDESDTLEICGVTNFAEQLDNYEEDGDDEEDWLEEDDENILTIDGDTGLPVYRNLQQLVDFTNYDFLESHIIPYLSDDVEDEKLLECLTLITETREKLLLSLKSRLKEEEWREFLLNRDFCEYFWNLSSASHLRKNYDNNLYEALKAREEFSIEYYPGLERTAEQIGDLLTASGLDEIYRHLVSRIYCELPRYTISKISLGIYYRLNLKVGMEFLPERMFLALGTLIHEAGHALEARIAHLETGQEIFDRYVLANTFEGVDFSSYANSFRISHGSNSRIYLQESFADDFRLYFLRYEKLSESKRQIFDEIMQRLFPDLDVDLIREKSRRVLGNFYGKNVSDVIAATSENLSRWFAYFLERLNRDD